MNKKRYSRSNRSKQRKFLKKSKLSKKRSTLSKNKNKNYCPSKQRGGFFYNAKDLNPRKQAMRKAVSRLLPTLFAGATGAIRAECARNTMKR